MLEILALWFLCTRMGKTLRAKGWKPLAMQILVVVGWIGSMFCGAVAYGVYVTLAQGPEAAKDIGFAVYPWMLLAAAVTEAILFGVAHLLRDRTRPPLLGFRQEQGGA